VTADVASRVRGAYRRSVAFFGTEIWQRRLDELPRGRARRYQLARIAQRTFRALVLDDELHVRAAALTYFTVLSLVPLLAFVFALLKGFGAYELLIHGTIRPYIVQFLSGNPALRDSFDKILGFVERTGVTSLGFLGLLTLLYAGTRLLRNIEGAFNDIWSIRSGRRPLEQLRDYISMIVVMPLCLMAAAGLATAGQATRMLHSASAQLGLGAVVKQLSSILGPLVVLFLGLLFLYKVMPYTHVRAKSAVVGAVIGALAWYLVLLAHVSFQIGVARFNALYSGFAAVPIFLAWLQISWLTVLVGAQITATHQNGRMLAQRKRLAGADQALRESISLAVMLRIVTAFLSQERPASLEQLARELDADDVLLMELLDALVRAELLVRALPNEDPRYVLARPPESIRLKDVLDALRRSPGDTPHIAHDAFGRDALALWRELDDATASAEANRSLAQVAQARLGDAATRDNVPACGRSA
jgi:membrane protein